MATNDSSGREPLFLGSLCAIWLLWVIVNDAPPTSDDGAAPDGNTSQAEGVEASAIAHPCGGFPWVGAMAITVFAVLVAWCFVTDPGGEGPADSAGEGSNHLPRTAAFASLDLFKDPHELCLPPTPPRGSPVGSPPRSPPCSPPRSPPCSPPPPSCSLSGSPSAAPPQPTLLQPKVLKQRREQDKDKDEWEGRAAAAACPATAAATTATAAAPTHSCRRNRAHEEAGSAPSAPQPVSCARSPPSPRANGKDTPADDGGYGMYDAALRPALDCHAYDEEGADEDVEGVDGSWGWFQTLTPPGQHQEDAVARPVRRSTSAPCWSFNDSATALYPPGGLTTRQLSSSFPEELGLLRESFQLSLHERRPPTQRHTNSPNSQQFPATSQTDHAHPRPAPAAPAESAAVANGGDAASANKEGLLSSFFSRFT